MGHEEVVYEKRSGGAREHPRALEELYRRAPLSGAGTLKFADGLREVCMNRQSMALGELTHALPEFKAHRVGRVGPEGGEDPWRRALTCEREGRLKLSLNDLGLRPKGILKGRRDHSAEAHL